MILDPSLGDEGGENRLCLASLSWFGKVIFRRNLVLRPQKLARIGKSV